MTEPRIISPGEELPAMEPPAPKPKRKQSAAAGDKRQTRDRFGVLNTFVDCSVAGLTKAEVKTWLVLYRDTRNGTVSTSAADIGRRIGVSKRRTYDAIAGLTRKGLLTRLRRGGLNIGPGSYRVHPQPREPT